jgi:hypothetical protein
MNEADTAKINAAKPIATIPLPADRVSNSARHTKPRRGFGSRRQRDHQWSKQILHHFETNFAEPNRKQRTCRSPSERPQERSSPNPNRNDCGSKTPILVIDETGDIRQPNHAPSIERHELCGAFGGAAPAPSRELTDPASIPVKSYLILFAW